MHPEIRREGIALLDETGDLTGPQLNEDGAEGHLTLLIGEFLAEHCRKRSGEMIGWVAIQHRVAELIIEHKHHWKKDLQEPGAEVPYSEVAVGRLEAMRLLRRLPEGVIPLPAICRFTVSKTTSAQASESHTLLSEP